MANDTTYDDSEVSLDEEPTMTEEERREKQAEAEFEMRLAEEEARMTARTALGMPQGQGRMYMGPKISQAQFDRIPVGGNINLAGPPVTAPSELERLQAADRPGTRTIAVQPPGMPPVTDVNFDMVNQAMQARKRYEAQKGFLDYTQAGGDPIKARAMFLPDVFAGPAGAKPRTPDKPLIHFGQKGEVLRADPLTGGVTVVRPPDAGPTIYRGPVIKFRRNEFGPEMSGHADDPAIIARQKLEDDAKAKAAAAEASTANAPGFMSRIGNLLAPTPSGLAPGAPPLGVAPPVAPPTTTSTRKTLTRAMAADFLRQAKGNKEEARRLAREAGYEF